MKHRLAIALLLLGLPITGVTLLVTYLARTVLDPNAFSDRFVAALGRPGVATFVAQQIADGVVTANRDLTGVKPVITTVAQSVVNSPPFHALARRGALEAHRLVFSAGAEHAMLAIPDVGVLLRGVLQTVSPEAAARVPVNVRTVIDTRLTGAMAGRVVTILRGADRLRLTARLGLICGLLLIAAGVGLARSRRQGLLDAGVGLLAIAAILAMAVPLGRAALVGTIADSGLRAAAGDLWNAFAGGLTTVAMSVAAVGLMIMAAAAALLERVALGEALRRAVRAMTSRQVSRGHEALRVTALLALGGFAMAAPLPTLLTITALAGTLVLALAVYDVVTFLAPPVRPSAEAAVFPHFHPALTVAMTCVVLAGAGMGGLALFLRLRPPAAAVVMEDRLECNGSAVLCERRLDDVTLAGAHNAMGSSDNPHWMFPNQDAAVPQLLRRGVRAFMLDVWRGHAVGSRIKTDFQTEEQRRKFEVAIGPEAFAAAMRIRDRMVGTGGPDGLYTCHGFCELGAVAFDTTLAQVKAFLVTNPTAVVLLILEDYVPPADIAAAFEGQGLTTYAYTGPSRGPLPTLRALIESNQRLVILGENDTGGLAWYHPAFEMLQETPYTFHAPAEFSCKPNRGEKDSPLFLMNHWIETTPAPRPSNAMLVNTEAVLVRRARACERSRGKRPNVIAVDFAATGDVVRAAAVLNGLEKPLATSPTP